MIRCHQSAAGKQHLFCLPSSYLSFPATSQNIVCQPSCYLSFPATSQNILRRSSCYLPFSVHSQNILRRSSCCSLIFIYRQKIKRKLLPVTLDHSTEHTANTPQIPRSLSLELTGTASRTCTLYSCRTGRASARRQRGASGAVRISIHSNPLHQKIRAMDKCMDNTSHSLCVVQTLTHSPEK